MTSLMADLTLADKRRRAPKDVDGAENEAPLTPRKKKYTGDGDHRMPDAPPSPGRPRRTRQRPRRVYRRFDCSARVKLPRMVLDNRPFVFVVRIARRRDGPESQENV